MSIRTTPTVAAVIALGVSTVGWTFAPIFIRLLRNDYEPLTQGCVRYLFGSAFLIGLCWVYHRAALLKLLRNPLPILGIGILNIVQQYAWTAGTYNATATTAQLIVKLSLVLVVVFAYVLFHEERSVIKSPIFLAGALLSMVGVAGVLVRDPRDLSHAFADGNSLLLFCAFTWAVYSVWGKHIVLDIHPLPMFAVVASFTAVGLGVLAVAFERPATAFEASAWTTFLIAVSGISAIGGAHPAFHYAQKHFGSAFSNTFMLIVPLTTYLASLVFLPAEGLSPSQMAGGATLLLGTLLITVAGNRKRLTAPASPVVSPKDATSPATERAL